MSSKTSVPSQPDFPEWFCAYLNIPPPDEGDEFQLNGQSFICRSGIPRSQAILSAAQDQTKETFGFKWQKRDTFDSEASLARMRDWLVERYGDLAASDWFTAYDDKPLLIDAGCGAGMSALELFGPLLPNINYLGIDVSNAIDVAKIRFAERGMPAAFMQADICNLPFSDSSVDLIFSEGVLHHTDSTKGAFTALVRLLKEGGRFMFYVYRRKGPVREFTDDYIRDQLQNATSQEAWEALEPLTRLGIALGETEVEIDIPQSIDLLGIPAGRINVQRLFYWHVAKMFYRSDLTLDELNHINYDWYTPANAHRQSPEEVRTWCNEYGLVVEREVVEDAGITVIARKTN